MSDKPENTENKAIKDEDIIDSSSEEEASREAPESATMLEFETEPVDQEKIAQMEKEHLYLRAELENIKRQNIKERSQLLKYGAERLARDLLDTLDIFKSALSTDVTAENYQDFIKGVKMTEHSLKSVLEKHGITELDCIGKPFDPNTQEALSSESSDEHPEGHVTQVFKSPYKYHDKLLRAGQVIVSRAKSE